MISSSLARQVIANGQSGLALLPKALFFGALGMLCLSSTAKAANTIILRYGETERTFEVDNIVRFSRTGEAATPELQSFFQDAPTARRLVQELLNAEISISPTLISKIERGLESPTGEFILIQIDKLIGSPSDTSEDLQPLKTAIVDAFQNDNRFSLLELVEQYPESEIRLDLTDLEPVFNDVKGFVERVLPALEVAREYLQDIICDCETTPAAQGTETRQSSAGDVPVMATQTARCNRQATVNPEATQITAPATVLAPQPAAAEAPNGAPNAVIPLAQVHLTSIQTQH